jgi:hypothetical protein
VAYFEYPHLKRFPEIRHAVFTRHSGHSRRPFDTLNSSFGVGDDPERVRQNRDIIRKSLKAETLVFTRQVHGTGVRVIDDHQSRDGGDGRPGGAAIEADALVTPLKHTFLVIQVADCQAIFLYDSRRGVIANIHAGWRGSIGNIVGRTIDIMREKYAVDPGHLAAAIGPSLGPCCAQFVNYRREIPPAFWPYKQGADRFDFWSVTRDQLRAAGVAEENVVTSHLCTRCHPEHFFSYRGEKTTGRFAAVIGRV